MMLEQVASVQRSLSDLVDGFVRGKVSVIMPAYNEAECIAQSIAEIERELSGICEDYEIIVVDDGSTDATRKIAEKGSNGRVRVVGYGANQGKGYAFRAGFQRVTGQFTFLMDSDLEIRPRELQSYLTALASSDFAIGSKRHPLSTVETPILRRFLSIGFNTLERLLTGVKAGDTQSGLKATRSATLYRILPLLSVKKYAFDAELLAVASAFGYSIKELPVQIRLRARFGVRQVFRMLIDLFGIAYRLRIRRWYQKNLLTMSETYKPLIQW